MCNSWCLDFAQLAVPYVGDKGTILEVGSRDVNGTIRDVISVNAREYVGVDIFEGPGVDKVVDVKDLTKTFGIESFDVVASTEMLEHSHDWQDALFQMTAVLRVGGILLITTRSPGFELHDYPGDYWRFSTSDFKNIFSPIGDILKLESDMTLGWPCGVGIILQKTVSMESLKKWHNNTKSISVYSMTDENNTSNFENYTQNNVIFDQYSRYRACSDIVERISESGTILDVGSGPECLLEKFIVDRSITFVDPLLASLNGEVDKRIPGNVFDPILDGREFDYVCSVDALEHVPVPLRKEFVQRVSSLAAKGIVLAFPCSDDDVAIQADKSIAIDYFKAYGKEYSWLNEHINYGLPYRAEVIAQLEDIGWNVSVVGHGHTPWLSQLLSTVVCGWDIPEAQSDILRISNRFNRELYRYDFNAPFYRWYVVATRDPLVSINLNFGLPIDASAERRFSEILADAQSSIFSTVIKNSQRLAVKYEAAVVERDAAVVERDAAVVERDVAVVERDAAVNERDILVVDKADTLDLIDKMVNSKSWRITKPFRFIGRLLRYGMMNDDREVFIKSMRNIYHRLPLPFAVKRVLRSGILHLVTKSLHKIGKQGLVDEGFCLPEIKPESQGIDKPDFIIWGVIDWYFRHQRPQQIAQSLSELGYRVIYVSSNLKYSDLPGFDLEDLDASGRLYQVTLYDNRVENIYSSAPDLKSVSQIKKSIGEVLDWSNSRRIVSLVQHPFWYDIARSIPNSHLVYDCMDHHEGFENTASDIVELEKKLFRTADLTVTTSTYLDKVVEQYTEIRTVIRNACDFDHFSRRPSKVYRDPEGRRIIGYYGAIAEWFDVDLVEAVAKHFSDCCILLIGADTGNVEARLGKTKNIKFIGEVPYKDIPYYLHGFDVCLLPFKIIPLTLATNPVKVYEYLSAGKKVVSVDLPELRNFEGLVNIADTSDGFISAVDSAINLNDESKEAASRQEYAKLQTWDHRANALISSLDSIPSAPKVSVIVVTYNNIELTKDCLKSLVQNSDYTSLEIIVVDNASTDGTQDFLKDWVGLKTNRKIILNGDNAGFAAANNQGLASADGDYLVLLNNDTYVTPGWVRSLVKHLEHDKSIGLIGPVTNNIGNEAKIDIVYHDMDEMIKKSSSYTRRRIGKTYPLRTAAFFCVMMRRDVYQTVGPLDEVFGRGFFEDDDYCRRIEMQGLRIVCAEDVFIHHHLSASFDKLKSKERQALFDNNKAIYEAKWGTWLPHNHRNR